MVTMFLILSVNEKKSSLVPLAIFHICLHFVSLFDSKILGLSFCVKKTKLDFKVKVIFFPTEHHYCHQNQSSLSSVECRHHSELTLCPDQGVMTLPCQLTVTQAEKKVETFWASNWRWSVVSIYQSLFSNKKHKFQLFLFKFACLI